MSFAEGTPTATIGLDRPRTLGFTLGAMRRIKERLGTLEVDDGDEEGQMLAIPTYVWACLPTEDREELSIESIEDMIHPRNLEVISDVITELFAASQPEGAEGKADPVPAKVRKAAGKR